MEYFYFLRFQVCNRQDVTSNQVSVTGGWYSAPQCHLTSPVSLGCACHIPLPLRRAPSRQLQIRLRTDEIEVIETAPSTIIQLDAFGGSYFFPG